MRTSSRVLIVIAGYAVAIVVAVAVVSIYVFATSGPDRENSSGMYAFGDAFLFLAVFGLAATPATGSALFFLRPYHSFWRVASIVALGVATTGIAALTVNLLPPRANTGSVLDLWLMLLPIRILLAPPFAITFLLSGLFAPARLYRGALLCATTIEVVVFIWVALIWFHSSR